ncbi:transcriptional regulator, partial [bacterium]|nr:transcriptional regulator [bacterium]
MPDFDETLSSAARMGIVAALITGEPVAFTDLKQRTGLADGNLHVQTRKLAG